MAFSERIQEHVAKLPAPFQMEVLNFVEYLLLKAERETAQPAGLSWSDLSLSSAMRGMEDEDVPAYTINDLKEKFS